MMIVRQTLQILILIAASANAHGQSACNADVFGEFDFWLGEWAVYSNGKVVGINKISKTHDGCVVHEQYTSGGGYSGSSYNIYDFNSGLWHQTWVDNSGLLLVLDGKLVDGNMVLEGATINDDGEAVDNRITWSPKDDGTVRQLWETRREDQLWTSVFDGIYKPNAMKKETDAE